MKERPILMSTPMVQAVLDGRKTMTRRVVKPQPILHKWEEAPNGQPWMPVGGVYQDRWECPYGKVGDRLWVREAFAIAPETDAVFYRTGKMAERAEQWGLKWKPSIHMPRAASRINLEITGVRVERLQEITWEDAIQEGLRVDGSTNGVLDKFESLWNELNAKRGFGWDVNPWVWVIEFKKITQ